MTFTLNTANHGGNGGAIFIGGGQQLMNVLLNIEADRNVAAGDGGAIYVEAAAQLNIVGSTLSYNVASGNGGAIAVDGSLSADSTTFRQSSAQGHGVGIYVGGAGSAAAGNCNFIGDTVWRGGGFVDLGGNWGLAYED